MATFTYVARTRQGTVKKGEQVAKTREEALEQLRRQGLTVTTVHEKPGGFAALQMGAASQTRTSWSSRASSRP